MVNETLPGRAAGSVCAAPAALELVGVSKHFGGATALSGVDLEFRRGEVHALVGENGAGKSTLLKILSGVLMPDEGEVRIAGSSVHLVSPRDAMEHGVRMVHQELMFVPGLDVVDNASLGFLRSHGRRERTRLVRDAAERLGFGDLPIRKVAVERLSLSQQQQVELVRAFAVDAPVILLDEPTAALDPGSRASLLESVRQLREDKRCIVYVSHYLEEVLGIADVVTVLRNGSAVCTGPVADHGVASLIEAMLGASESVALVERSTSIAQPVLEARNVILPPLVAPVSFDVRHGEILGLAGLAGSGHQAVLHALAGASSISAGSLRLEGMTVEGRSRAHLAKAGVAYVPPSRRDDALHMEASILDNIAMAHRRAYRKCGVLRGRRLREDAGSVLRRMSISTVDVDRPVHNLSGGNQQKVVIGRWLLKTPRILVADEPTRGVDVGARRSIHNILLEFANAGGSVVVASSELEELLELCDRIVVFRSGRIAEELQPQTTSSHALLQAIQGQSSEHESKRTDLR